MKTYGIRREPEKIELRESELDINAHLNKSEILW